MAAGIKLTPYQPTGQRTPAVPGGGYLQVDPSAGDFGQGAAQGLARGAQILKSEVLPELEKAKARDDDASVADIDGQARRRLIDFLHDPEKGFLAKKGRNAADAFKDASDELEKMRTEYKSLARNDQQRLMADKVLGARFDSALDTMTSHTRGQRLLWQQATFAARADNAGADAAAAGDDDAKIIMAIRSGQEAEAMRLDLAGLGEEAKGAAIREWRSKQLTTVLDGKMVRNPDSAIAWYDRNKVLFAPGDRPVIERKLKDARESRDVLVGSQSYQSPGSAAISGGVRVTDAVVEGDPRAIPRAYAPQVQGAAQKHGVPVEILAGLFYNESRYRPGAVASGDQREINPATGKAFDSVGIGQWGEQWAKARGFDPRDANASIDHTAQALAEYAKKYGGNWALARMAYGMGAGNVDKWLAAGGDPSTLSADVRRFVGQAFTGKDGIEAERATLAMGRGLAGATNRQGAVTGADVTTTAKPEPRLADALAEVDRRYAGADPVLKERARSAYTSRWQQLHTEWKDSADKDWTVVQSWVLGNPGRSITEIPPALMLALSLEDQQKAKAYAEKVRKGADVDDDATYEELHRMATSPDANVRQAFADMRLLPMRAKLSKSSWDKFVGMQGDIRKNDPDGNIQGERTLREVVNDTLRSVLRVDPTPKEGSSDAETVAAFRRSVDFEVAAQTRANGRKLKPEEIQKIVDDKAKPVAGTGGFLSSDVRRYALKPTDVPKDIGAAWDKVFTTDRLGTVPDDVKVTMFAAMQAEPAMKAKPEDVAAVASWLARNGKPVTETGIINYWRFLQQRRAVAGPVSLPAGAEPPPAPTSKDFGAVEVPNADEPPPVNPRELGYRTGVERGVRRWWQGVIKP